MIYIVYLKDQGSIVQLKIESDVPPADWKFEGCYLDPESVLAVVPQDRFNGGTTIVPGRGK